MDVRLCKLKKDSDCVLVRILRLQMDEETFLLVWIIVVVVSIPIITFGGAYLADRCEAVDKKKGQIYRNKEAHDLHKKFHSIGLVWMPPELKFGGVDVTETVKTSTRADGTPKTVRTIVALDDETGRVRRMVQELPLDESQNKRKVLGEFNNWEEFATERPDIESILESPHVTPTASPVASPVASPPHTRATSPTVMVPQIQTHSQDTHSEQIVPDVKQSGAADVMEEMLRRAEQMEKVEQGEEGLLDEFDLEGTQHPVHLIRTLRPVWRLDGSMKHIDTLQLTTTLSTTEPQSFESLYNQQWHLNTHYAHTPEFEYNHELRVEVEYENGKVDVHRNLDEWAKVMIGWMNEYDCKYGDEGVPKVRRMRVWLVGKEDYATLRQGGYKVRASAGFPEVLMVSAAGELLRMDLVRTSGSCATAAFFTWWALTVRSGNGKSLFEMWRSYDEMVERWKEFKGKCKELGIGVQWCTDDFTRICSKMMLSGETVPKLVQYFEDNPTHMRELQQLRADDFTSATCHLLISKSMHASLVWPMQQLPRVWQTTISNKMKRTYDRKIVKGNLNAKRVPYEYINTLDIESLIRADGVHVPQLLCFVYQNQAYSVHGYNNPVEAFVEWVISKNVSMEFWAHNLKYDGAFFNGLIFKYCNKNLQQPAKIPSNSRGIIKCTYHLTNNRTLTIRDSFSHLNDNLNNLGKTFCNRGKLDYDVLQLKQPEQFWTNECISYCVNDCELLRDVLNVHQTNTIKSYGLNPLRFNTLASYAKNSALLSISSATPLYTLAPTVDEFIHNGYHGGRCEVFAAGEHSTQSHSTQATQATQATHSQLHIQQDQILVLDFNSHYSAMMIQDLPHGKPIHIDCRNIPPDELYEWLQLHRGFYDVQILYEPPELRFKLFGSVDGHGRYTFTTATGQTYAAEETDTLLYALRLGYKLKLLHGYCFDYAPYLRDWTLRMYQDKVSATIEGNQVKRNISKLILNSVTGSFGTKWRDCKQYAAYGAQYSKQLHNNATLGFNSGTTQNGIWCGTEVTNLLLSDTNVSISSCITSRARMKLHQTMMQVEQLGARVLYVDTDSLIIRTPDYSRIKHMIHPTELGSLKLEANLSTFTLLAPKAYSYTDVVGKVVNKLRGLNINNCTHTPDVPKLLSSALLNIPTTIQTTKIFRPKYLTFTLTPIVSKLLTYTFS